MAQSVGAALLRTKTRELAVAAKAAAVALQAERKCAAKLLGTASKHNTDGIPAVLVLSNDVEPPLGLKCKSSTQLGKALARWEAAPGSLDPLLFAVVPVAEAEHALWRLLHAVEAAAPVAEADVALAVAPVVVEEVPADNTDACADLGNFVAFPLPRSVDDAFCVAPTPVVSGPEVAVRVLHPDSGVPLTPLIVLPSTSVEEIALEGLPVSVTAAPSLHSQDSGATLPPSSHGRSRWVGTQPSGRHLRQFPGRPTSGAAGLREARADEPRRKRPGFAESQSVGATAAQTLPLREELRGLHWGDDVARWRREAGST